MLFNLPLLLLPLLLLLLRPATCCCHNDDVTVTWNQPTVLPPELRELAHIRCTTRHRVSYIRSCLLFQLPAVFSVEMRSKRAQRLLFVPPPAVAPVTNVLRGGKVQPSHSRRCVSSWSSSSRTRYVLFTVFLEPQRDVNSTIYTVDVFARHCHALQYPSPSRSSP